MHPWARFKTDVTKNKMKLENDRKVLNQRNMVEESELVTEMLERIEKFYIKYDRI